MACRPFLCVSTLAWELYIASAGVLVFLFSFSPPFRSRSPSLRLILPKIEPRGSDEEDSYEGTAAAYLDKCLAHPPETHISAISGSLISDEVILSYHINIKCRVIGQLAAMRTQRPFWPKLFTSGFHIWYNVSILLPSRIVQVTRIKENTVILAKKNP